MHRALQILSLFLLLTQVGRAQSFHFRQYSVNDGLPASQTYDLLEDSKGYIWIGTENGVSRFNGYEFTNYGTEDGLTNDVVFRLSEDYQGRIWCGTYLNNLCYFEGDSIYAFEHNDQLTDLVGLSVVRTFHVSDDDSVRYGLLYGGLVNMSIGDGGFTHYDSLPGFEFGHGFHLLDSTASTYTITAKSGVSRQIGEPCVLRIKVPRFDLDTLVQFSEDVLANLSGSGFGLYSGDDEAVLVSGTQLIVVKSSGEFVLKTAPSRCINIYRDREGSIWLGCFKDGVYVYPNGDLDAEPEHYLEDESVSSILQDREGSFWFTTTESGIYYASPPGVINLDSKIGLGGEHISTISGYGDLAYVGYGSGMVDAIDVSTFELKGQFKGVRAGNSVVGMEVIPERNKLYVAGVYSYWSKSLSSLDTPIDEFFFTAFLDLDYQNDTLWTISHAGVGYLDDEDILQLKLQNFGYDRMSTMWHDERGELYVGSLRGLVWSHHDSLVALDVKYPALSNRIEQIEVAPNGTMVLASRGVGLIFWDGKRTWSLTTDHGLSSNALKSLTWENDTILWVGSNRGVSRLRLGVHDTSVVNYTQRSGLVSEEVQDLGIFADKLWIGTRGGLSILDLSLSAPNEVAPPVYITGMAVNNEFRALTDSLSLEHNENFLRINFCGLAYRMAGKVKYRYRMLPLDTTWYVREVRFAEYTSLPPGQYHFEVQAANEDGLWSTHSATVDVTIARPWWATWYFRAAVVAVIVLLFLLVFRLRLRQVKRRESMQFELKEMELRALRAQMNPHFTFNTMNSIQHFMLHEQYEQARYYLNRFSKLLRSTLEHSRLQVVTLSEEVNLLKLYMELESLRFDEAFDQVIELDKALDLDFEKIPSMLLQPFVENAVWHGLSTKEGKGRIEIHFQKVDEDFLRVSVTDNGIGRELAAMRRVEDEEGHRSRGMEITRERVHLLNPPSRQKDAVRITDLKDDEGAAAGTRVDILIPLQ